MRKELLKDLLRRIRENKENYLNKIITDFILSYINEYVSDDYIKISELSEKLIDYYNSELASTMIGILIYNYQERCDK